MRQKSLLSKLVVLMAALAVGTGHVWADDAYKTALFGSSYNSNGISSYTSTFTATNNGFTVTVANFNNNNNGWDYIKCGRKNSASTATIVTAAVIDKAISKVSVTLDAITTNNVTSIKLYTSSDNSTWTESGSFDKSTGTKEVNLNSPAENLYYKVEFVCTSASSNGIVQVSKVEYYQAEEVVLDDTDAGLNYATTSYSVRIDNDFTAPALTNPRGLSVGYSSSATGVATVDIETGAITLVGAGETTITAALADAGSYTENTSASYTLTVTDKGTLANPYTVAEATAFITGGGSTSEYVYTKGIVSEIGGLSSNQLSYYISDDGKTTNQLYIYKGKNIENTNFNATTDIAVGDEVIVYGTTQYYQNTTPEYSAGNYIYAKKYELSIDDLTNGSVSVTVDGAAWDGSSRVWNGAAVVATATPATDYVFTAWDATLDEYDANTNPLSFTMPTDDVIIGASFKDANQSYTITLDNVSNGTIEASAASAKSGVEITLTATPDDGYQFTGWYVLDDDDNEITVTADKFTMPANNVTVSATFKQQFTVTYYICGEENTVTRLDGEALSLDEPAAVNGMPFYKWSSVSNATSPVFVENTTAVSADMTLYAIFVASATNSYNLVEADQTDWRGDYIIAYSSTVMADGRVGGTGSGGIGAQNVKVSPGTKLNGKIIDSAWADTYNVTLEAIDDAKLSGGYVMKTKDGKYNYQTSNANGLSVTENKSTAATYPLSITFNSSSNIAISISAGAIFHYNGSGYFRFYKDGGQSAVYMYKKVSVNTYTLALPTTVTVTDAKYATCYAEEPLDFSETGATVYTAAYNSEKGSVELTEVEDGIVPAGQGVIIYKDVNESTELSVPVTTTTKTLTGNELKVSDGSTAKGDDIYVLANKSNGVGFYRWTSETSLTAGRVYMQMTVGGGAREFIGFGDESTGVQSISTAQQQTKQVYNLSGQRVSAPAKGLYIRDGKKYFVK